MNVPKIKFLILLIYDVETIMLKFKKIWVKCNNPNCKTCEPGNTNQLSSPQKLLNNYNTVSITVNKVLMNMIKYIDPWT